MIYDKPKNDIYANLPSLKEARASKKFPEYVNGIRPSCYKKETMATRSKTESKGSIGSQKSALN